MHSSDHQPEDLIDVVRELHPELIGKKVGVAFSGGRDSVVLLDILLQLKTSSLHILHVNHNVRDEESVQEEMNFVEHWAAKNKTPLQKLKLQEKTADRENDLRNARYQVLAQKGLELELDWIALGHHAGDQAETLLMRMCRGSNLRGLCGMPAFFTRNEQAFVRPILSVDPNMLDAYVQRRQLDFFQDPSNFGQHHTRNLFRHQILTQMEGIEKGCTMRIAGMSKVFQDLQDMKAELLKKHQKDIEWKKNKNTGEWECDRLALQKLPDTLIKQWCYDSISALSNGEKKLHRQHVEKMVQFILSDQLGYFSETLPGQQQLRARKDKIIFRTLGRNSSAQ